LFRPQEMVPSGTMAIVTGWGFDQCISIKDQLFMVTVPIIDSQICSEIFEETSIGIITSGEICAGSYGMSSCQGDSGSPLVIEGRQAGIVSRGVGCLYPQYPGVYVDVGYFSSWITNQISN
jgi:secreted trypsin-like serine protease